jgi:hypothetical protein
VSDASSRLDIRDQLDRVLDRLGSVGDDDLAGDVSGCK